MSSFSDRDDDGGGGGVETPASSSHHSRAHEALAKIDTWTSPRLKSRPEVYDADVWFQQEMQSPPTTTTTTTGEDSMQVTMATSNRRRIDDDDDASGKKQQQQQRSTTPIMSNYSTPAASTKTKKTTATTTGKKAAPPPSVFTKAIRNRDDGGGVDTPFRPFVTKTPRRPRRSVVSSTRQDAVHRQYHDALWTFLQERRQLEKQQGSNTSIQPYRFLSISTPSATPEQLDLDYFTSLEIAKDGDSMGLWLLLKHLRKLDNQPLISTPFEMLQKKQELSNTLIQTAASSSANTTPARLVKSIHKESPYLQRRQALVKWLQEWIRKDLIQGTTTPSVATDNIMWPNTLQELQRNKQQYSSFPNPNKISSLHPDAPLVLHKKGSSGNSNAPGAIMSLALFGTDAKKDQEMLQKCWSYIQADMNQKVIETTKQYGQIWRSAVWSGREWYDVVNVADDATQTMIRKEVGNSNYFVWKNKIRTLAKQQALLDEERIIHAYMSGDVQTLLSLLGSTSSSKSTTSSSSSWRSGLLGCCAASIQNVEELAVHQWFTQLRRQEEDGNPVIPGSNTLKAEEECIASAQRLETEQDMLLTLNALPYPTMQGTTNFLRRTLSMLVLGEDVSLEAWCTQESNAVGDGSTDEMMTSTTTSLTDDELRWMVHLLVYLEKRQQDCNKNEKVFKLLPSHLKSLAPVKNRVVLEYIQHLASHPSLWRLLALYASLLSTEQVVNVFPQLLVPMEEPEERNYMVRAMQDCFTTMSASYDDKDDDGNLLVQQLLMQTVHLILLDDTKPFVTKALSMGWLGILPHHASCGLICANQLCRQLLLVKDTDNVVEFLELYCPKSILQYDDDDGEYDDEYAAQRELKAIQAYLDASSTFDQWKSVMEKAVAELDDDDDEEETDEAMMTIMDDENNAKKKKQQQEKMKMLSTREQEMLTTLNRRSKSQRLEVLCEQACQIALEACMKLRNVLEFDGGWLVDQDDKEKDDEDDDDDPMDPMSDDDDDDDDEIPMDPRRLEELEMLRRMYIPDVIFLMHNICDETCKYLERTSEWTTTSTSSYHDVTSILSPGYWYHMGTRQLAIASAKTCILNILGQRELRLLTSKLRELTMRELDWKQEQKAEQQRRVR